LGLLWLGLLGALLSWLLRLLCVQLRSLLGLLCTLLR
jgi:hypothetical protein